MTAYPVLRVDTFTHPEARAGAWQSAMTFKFVGALRGLGHLAAHQTRALEIGFAIGLVVQIARKALVPSARWKAFVASGRAGLRRRLGRRRGRAVEPVRVVVRRLRRSVDVDVDGRGRRRRVAARDARGAPPPRARPRRRAKPLPEDMSTNSLVGGGLIAGESLYTLVAGIVSLLALLR